VGAALAAGELPSPEMLAASGETGTLRPRTAVMLLALVLVPLVVLGVLFEQTSLLGRLPSSDSPDVLAHGAREIAEDLAVLPDGDDAYWFSVDIDARRWLGDRVEGDDDAVYDDPPIHPLQLVWRAQPGSMNPREPLVAAEDPPFVAEGAVRIRVDARGRLLELRRIPPSLESSAAEGDDDERAWTKLLERTGLVLDGLQPATPAMLPRDYADERRAWTGAWPDGTPAHVEGASVRGVPVELTVVGPWAQRYGEIEAGHADEGPAEGTVFVGTRGGTRVVEGLEAVALMVLALLVLLVVVGAFLLAIRSVRRGEGDRRTAARVALFVTISVFASGSLGSHSIGSALLSSPVERLPSALLDGLIIWLAYIAIEPYARRFWPHSLVSWSRFVRGRWRDPLVGRDVLVGSACACVLIGAAAVIETNDPARLDFTDGDLLLGARHALAKVVDLPRSGLWMACMAFVAVLVARLALRRQLPTVIATIVAPTLILHDDRALVGERVHGARVRRDPRDRRVPRRPARRRRVGDRGQRPERVSVDARDHRLVRGRRLGRWAARRRPRDRVVLDRARRTSAARRGVLRRASQRLTSRRDRSACRCPIDDRARWEQIRRSRG
ncbi:MAG TPA: hypothetical protein VFG69_04685, partial [Nannocystaceae bacterium]|nr:hypothetical protein [Nannocystaceae bacterium]